MFDYVRVINFQIIIIIIIIITYVCPHIFAAAKRRAYV